MKKVHISDASIQKARLMFSDLEDSPIEEVRRTNSIDSDTLTEYEGGEPTYCKQEENQSWWEQEGDIGRGSGGWTIW